MTNSPVVTSYDVAKEAQVSIGTVFRVLNNTPGVKENLRSRVLKVIDDLGYIHIPKKKAGESRSLASTSLLLTTAPTDRTPAAPTALKTVLFCVPVKRSIALQEAYFYKILRGVEEECSKNKLNLMYRVVEDTPASVEQIKELMEFSGVNGLVLLNYASDELLESLKGLGIPVVLVDPRQPRSFEFDTVLSDSAGGALVVTEHLIAQGHQTIAFLTGPLRYGTKRRLEGYRNALLDAGLQYRPELVVSGEQTTEGGEAAMQELLGKRMNFSAVFCSNDLMAFGAIRSLNAAGLRVPENVSVVGFDNLDAGAVSHPPLTSVDTDTESKGSIAIRRLIEQAYNPFRRSFWSVIPVKLIVRDSTRPYQSAS